ncbi:MAG: ribbon-helix-helix domain-containing protein [Candidatus Pacearchaeota archaeon]
MKERASFTFDKETISLIDGLIDSGEFRNRSHVVEHAIKNLSNGNNIVNENKGIIEKSNSLRKKGEKER